MYCIRHDDKEYYIGTKEHFEDYLREVCGEEAFEAYNNLVMGDSNIKEVENLKYEINFLLHLRLKMVVWVLI